MKRTESELYDLAIIGGGPAGLHSLFYATYQGLKVFLIDSRDRVGGKIRNLHPGITLYNVPGYSEIHGEQYISNLEQQLRQFPGAIYQGHRLVGMEKIEEGYLLTTDGSQKNFKAKMVLHTTGKGTQLLTNHKENTEAENHFEKEHIHFNRVTSDQFVDRNVLVYGFTKRVVDYCKTLLEVANSVTLVSRFAEFTFPEAKLYLDSLQGLNLLKNHDIQLINCKKDVLEVNVIDLQDEKNTIPLEFDEVVLLAGEPTNLQKFQDFGFAIEKNGILVNQVMETTLQNCFAAGDAAGYYGKVFSMRSTINESITAIDEMLQRGFSVCGKGFQTIESK